MLDIQLLFEQFLILLSSKEIHVFSGIFYFIFTTDDIFYEHVHDIMLFLSNIELIV